MNILVKNLGKVTEGDRTKFILLEDGTLLYGICQWHKDLGEAGHIGNAKVIGAGMVPDNKEEDEDVSWGDWKSTGYGVVTPEELRDDIKKALGCV